ncbi:MAG: hypothetical protein J7M25_15110 [Deltaproteobacteria bacterium]|nr:hypothetical protein [Deltaproteobacteria bacterium]
MAHPDLPQTAAELVELYQQKDAMEKDFETMVPPRVIAKSSGRKLAGELMT